MSFIRSRYQKRNGTTIGCVLVDADQYHIERQEAHDINSGNLVGVFP